MAISKPVPLLTGAPAMPAHIGWRRLTDQHTVSIDRVDTLTWRLAMTAGLTVLPTLDNLRLAAEESFDWKG